MPAFIDVSGLLYPKSIAVIGASDRAGDLGGDTVRCVVRFGFPGKIWAVNPSAESVHGVQCFPTIDDLPETPDLVILSMPADTVVETIRACAARGTRNGMVFAEVGGDGVALQNKLAAVCRDVGFTLCGPNCIGIINAGSPVTATCATALSEFDTLRAGPISMVTQSSGIGMTTFSVVQRAGFGFRHLISSGNEAVVRFADYLYALAHDEGTRIIAGYLEGIGDGARLVRALEEARDRGKKIVLIKCGATRASARAASIGEDHVFDAILQELGVIRVHSVEALVDVCLLLAGTEDAKLPRGRGVGIVTFGGGNGVLAAEQCAAHGLTVPALASVSVKRLRPLLVPVAAAANPMDLTPTTASRAESLARLPAAMDVLAAQPDIDSLLFIADSLAEPAAEIIDMIAGFSRRCAKPVCVCWPSPPADGAVARLAAVGIVAFDEPDRGLRALGRLVAHGEALSRPRPGAAVAMPFAWEAHVEPGTNVVTEDRCRAILIDAGLPVTPGRLAIDAAAALPIAHEIGFPVALKAISPKVTHRVAAGLLAIELRNAEEVVANFRRLEDRARANDIVLDGIYVQKMPRGGVELLVSVSRDPVFGTIVSCGGGPAALIDDVVTARAPVTLAVAAGMVERLRCRAPARDGQGLLDVTAPAAFIARLSQLGACAPWQTFSFEINPIKWTRAGVVAVDGLLVIE
jgi:acetate---CoA ligase (ADP-forming)